MKNNSTKYLGKEMDYQVVFHLTDRYKTRYFICELGWI